ncbi:hypothetical protein M426DRAFT_26919 [Hypoxylon sp. CI-4A]|nr:hypothetical protein M426DRAFT_26919 [Hypoxylon sp. CI-4A]
MSDPFSVMGTAVGVVSLGIQVCQGLVSYLRSARGSKREIADALREVQSLSSIYYSVNEALPSISQRRVVESLAIQQCLRDSERSLQEFQALLSRFKRHQSHSSVAGKIRDAGFSLVYPFQQEKLVLLRETSQRLLDNLSLAIGIASMNMGVETDDKTRAIETTIEDHRHKTQTQSNIIENLSKGVQENISQLQLLQTAVVDAAKDIDQHISYANWKLEDMGSNLNGTLTMVQRDATSTRSMMIDRFTEILDRLDGINGKLDAQPADFLGMRIQLSRIDREGLRGKGYCDRGSLPSARLGSSEIIGSNTPRAKSSRRLTAVGTRAKSTRCDCPQKGYLTSYSYSFCGMSFQLDQQTPCTHRRGCVYFGIDQDVKRSAEVQFPIRMARFFIRATQACIIYTTGSSLPEFSIRFKNTVPSYNNPVHSVIKDFICSSWKTSSGKTGGPKVSTTLRLIKLCEQRIISLYRERKVLPSDRDEYRKNPVVEWVADIFHENLLTLMSVNELVMTTTMRLMQTLVNNAKPEDELFRFRGPTVVKNPKNMHQVVSFLLDNFDFGSAILSPTISSAKPSYLEYFPRVKEAIGMELSPIAWAITNRSLRDLRLQMRRNPETSLDLLMKTNCYWEMSWLGPQMSDEIVTIIASNFVERRWRLLKIAQEELQILPSYDSANDPDGEASFLCQVLDEAGIPIPEYLRVPQSYTSIYHERHVPISLFPIFFDNGFQHYNKLNDMGLTPIMIWRYNDRDLFQMVPWLHEHGLLDQKAEDRWGVGLNTSTTGWHYLAAIIGSYDLKRYRENPHEEQDLIGNPMGWEALQYFSDVKIRDDCTCWCNPEGKGCSPIKSMWKAYLDRPETASGIIGDLRRAASMHFLLHDVSLIGEKENRLSGLSLELVRLLTFEALEMKHTCCGFKRVNLKEQRLCIPSDYDQDPYIRSDRNKRLK